MGASSVKVKRNSCRSHEPNFCIIGIKNSENRCYLPTWFSLFRIPFSVQKIELVQKELKLLNVEDPAKRSIALPILQPLAKATAGRFDTTFLYKDVRISRGRFGEIRVFQRVG